MKPHLTLALRRHSFHVLLGACAAGLSLPALAQTAVAAAVASAATDMAAAAAPAADDNAPMTTVEISSRKTRSSVALSKSEMQKILPGMNPLKALQTLPGVSFQTADPWGNNEQNLSLFIHGFSGPQLGYTMDGVPLGDQQYGNYNGLSPQRAVISENVGSVDPVVRRRRPVDRLDQQPGRHHRDLLQRSAAQPQPGRCSKPSAATAPRAPSCATTPATSATATAPTSRPSTTSRRPGTSTAARAATRSTPSTSTRATPAS